MTGRLWAPWSLRELVTEIREGLTTAEAAHARARATIAGTESHVHAWVELAPDVAPTPTGALGGVPLAVKDIIDVAGLATRCGSVLREKADPAVMDAVIVDRWRQAGAVPIGKTVTTEFAYFSPGPTRNPAALGHTPGGSSSGSAAAVASGQVPLALGSQTAGSVIRPASYCGVAAIVMSQGRIATTGVTGLSHSLDAHGVYAASASDLGLAWSALSGEPDPGVLRRQPRLLLWTAGPVTEVDADMGAQLRSACDRLSAAGAVVDPFPHEALVADITRAHPTVMAYEAARERAAELARASQLSEPLARLLGSGADTRAESYESARGVIDGARTRIGELLGAYDAIIGPAAPGAAPDGLAATGDPVLSRAWQALGLPVVAVPSALSAAGLPLGIQLIGPSWHESDLLSVASWVEEVLNDTRPGEASTPAGRR
ncbi:MAG: amidase [Aeromicrobium sp.]